jgi:hypothetical protein
MKAVQKKKGAVAIKEAKKGKVYRRKNKSKLNKLAKQRYKTMTPAEKLKFHARQVFTKAMRHGATEAEAKKVVMAWKKRRKHRAAGTHAAGQKREVTAAQRQIREQIRKKSLGLQSAHQKALSKIRSAKVPPAKRAAMRQAEKASYANARKTLAGERTKAAASHRQAMKKIKPKGKFSLKSLISNYKAKPISTQGKRLVDIGAKAAKDGVARIAAKHFGNAKPAAKKAAGGVTKKAPKSAAASPAAAPKKVGRPKNVGTTLGEGEKPTRRALGSPTKAKPAAAAPAAEKRKPGRPKKVAAAPAAAAEAKPKRKYTKKAVAAPAAAPAAEKRKPGRPKKVAAAAPAAAPAAEKRKPGRPKKVAAEAAKPAAKAPAKKPTKSAAAKKPAAAAPAAEKRKPGRPKKVTEAAAPAAEKRKPGRPKKVAAAAPAAKPAAKAKAKEKAAAKAPAKKPTKAAAAKPAAKAAPAKKKVGGAVPKAKFG